MTTVFDLLTQPRTKENLARVEALYGQLMREGVPEEAATLAKVFHLDVEKLVVVPVATFTNAEDSVARLDVVTATVPEQLPLPQTVLFKDEVRAALASISEDIGLLLPAWKFWEWNSPPDFEEWVARRPDVVFAEIEKYYLREVVTAIQEAGYYVEFVGKLAKEKTSDYQLVRIERSKTLGEWFKSFGDSPRFANKTRWKKEQLETLQVLGFYQLTTRLVVRRGSPKAKDNGAYYFLYFTKVGSGPKAKEVVAVEDGEHYQFGTVNPYLHLDCFRYKTEQDDQTWRRIYRIEADLEFEADLIKRQRREWLHHLYRESRRRWHLQQFSH